MTDMLRETSPYVQTVCAALEAAPEVMGDVGSVHDVRMAVVHGVRPFFDDVQVFAQGQEMVPEDLHHPYKKAIDAHDYGSRLGVSGFIASTAVGNVLYVEKEMLLPAYQTPLGIRTIASAAGQGIDRVAFGGFSSESGNYWGAVGMINYARNIAALLQGARNEDFRRTKAGEAFRYMVASFMKDRFVGPESALMQSREATPARLARTR